MISSMQILKDPSSEMIKGIFAIINPFHEIIVDFKIRLQDRTKTKVILNKKNLKLLVLILIVPVKR